MEIRKCCDDIIFQHLIDLPNCDCVFCAACESKSGKTRLFLVFNEQRRIYIRNGIKDTWDELKDEHDYDQIRQRFNRAIAERDVPCFTAAITNYNDVLRG